MNFIKQEQH